MKFRSRGLLAGPSQWTSPCEVDRAARAPNSLSTVSTPSGRLVKHVTGWSTNRWEVCRRLVQFITHTISRELPLHHLQRSVFCDIIVITSGHYRVCNRNKQKTVSTLHRIHILWLGKHRLLALPEPRATQPWLFCLNCVTFTQASFLWDFSTSAVIYLGILTW